MAGWTAAGKLVLLTGPTNGIGLAASERLASLGTKLAIVARSQARAEEAVARIHTAASGGQVEVLLADLSSQSSVRHLAAEILERFARIDVLVNNAGAMFSRRTITEDMIERTWAVNHLAPFLLTTLLLDRMKASAPARVVITSSDAHRMSQMPFADLGAERSYRPFRRYGQTKLANILFTVELARRLQGTGVTANCFHPGLVATGLNRNNGPLANVAMTLL